MTYRIVEVEQGSDAWLEWRQNKRTASVAGCIMGVAEHGPKSWSELRMELAGLGDGISDFAQEMLDHGNKGEAECREMLFPNFRPVAVEQEDGPYAASLDGWLGADWLEIKTCAPHLGTKSRTWGLISDLSLPLKERIRPQHWWQITHQAMVVGQPGSICYFTVWVDKNTHATLNVPYEDLEPGFAELQQHWDWFADGAAEGDQSPEWIQAASRWRNADTVLREARKDEKEARIHLEMLAGGHDKLGAGVKLTHVESQSPVDWKTLCEHLIELAGLKDDIDLNAWRKRKRLSIRVSRTD